MTRVTFGFALLAVAAVAGRVSGAEFVDVEISVTEGNTLSADGSTVIGWL